MIGLKYAINAVVQQYGGKICRIAENTKAYFIQRASDDGEIAMGDLPIRVDKETGKTEPFPIMTSKGYEPPKRIPFPEGLDDVFVERKIYE